jgi:hypothetical protein
MVSYFHYRGIITKFEKRYYLNIQDSFVNKRIYHLIQR